MIKRLYNWVTNPFNDNHHYIKIKDMKITIFRERPFIWPTRYHLTTSRLSIKKYLETTNSEKAKSEAKEYLKEYFEDMLTELDKIL